MVRRKLNEVVFENPGNFRMPIELAISGGVSDPRNAVLMKMFNLLNIGERAGSGVPNIFHVWRMENLSEPQYEETMDCSRTKLTLPIDYTSDKQAINAGASDKQAINAGTSDKQAINASTSDKRELIFDSIEESRKYKASRCLL